MDEVPTREREPAPDDFVDVAEIDPTIVVEMRYATKDNFTKVAFYPIARCMLRRAAGPPGEDHEGA